MDTYMAMLVPFPLSVFCLLQCSSDFFLFLFVSFDPCPKYAQWLLPPAPNYFIIYYFPPVWLHGCPGDRFSAAASGKRGMFTFLTDSKRYTRRFGPFADCLDVLRMRKIPECISEHTLGNV
ncbi:hypothetical protein J3F83DRAFT_742043 [Trichoderma novae-zelandiae]